MKKTTKTDAENKILGKKEPLKVKKIKNYEIDEILYKVTNLELANTPIIVKGDVIESFIGYRNLNVRESLKSGKKIVYTSDINGKKQYKIEVI